MHFLRQTFRIVGAAIDDNFDAFFSQEVNGLLDSVPCCLLPARVLACSMGFCVLGNVDLCGQVNIVNLRNVGMVSGPAR